MCVCVCVRGVKKCVCVSECESGAHPKKSALRFHPERPRAPSRSPLPPHHTTRVRLTQSLSHSVTQPLSHSVTQSLSHSVTQSLSHSVTQSLSHSITQSLSHSATQSLSQSVTCSSSFIRIFIYKHTIHTLTQSVTQSVSHLVT